MYHKDCEFEANMAAIKHLPKVLKELQQTNKELREIKLVLMDILEVNGE